MGMTPTGNGRRQGYAHLPMPRIDEQPNMLAGEHVPAEIIGSVKNGDLLPPNFGGGQVDNHLRQIRCFQVHRGL